jgi:CheY-like chemotaxis protein
MLEPALRSLRVLVVDDEESIRRSLVRFLQRRGHTVEVAASGLEALQRIDDAPVDATFDVVLTDLRMPELGGDQLFRLLRARGRGLERRLVFVTGDSATSSAHEFLVSTGQPVLMKPFALEELAHVVESHAAA